MRDLKAPIITDATWEGGVGADEMSNTDMALFGECARRYWYAVERGLKPRVKGHALNYGTLVHACLEAFYNGDVHYTPVIDAWHKARMAELGKPGCRFSESDVTEAAETTADIMERYIAKYASDFDTLSLLAVEAPMKVRFRTPPTAKCSARAGSWWYVGKCDLIAYDVRRKLLVVMDHKTTGTKSRDTLSRMYETSPQKWAYPFAVRRAFTRFNGDQEVVHAPGSPMDGMPVHGIVWVYNFLRKKVPASPKWTQGRKSKKTGEWLERPRVSLSPCDTLFEVYQEHIARMHPDDVTDKHRQMAESLFHQGDTFLHRLEIAPQPYVETMWQREAHETMRGIRRSRRTDRWPRNFNRCNALIGPCEYAPICVDPYGSDLDGLDSPERVSRLFEEHGRLPYLERRRDDELWQEDDDITGWDDEVPF